MRMKPKCRDCKHFFVTFEQATPNGCRAYQIKSKMIPSMVVKQANGGAECIGFEAKPTKRKAKNLNDPSLW